MIDTKALREKILDLAIRGKLVPQDPNDEPASVLLERIRAQKQQLVKEGKLKAKDIKNDTIIFKGEDNLHYEQFQDGTVKCIEAEIPFKIPEGWAWSRLQSICEPITDGTHQTPVYSDSGYIFLSAKNITTGSIDWNNVMHIPESLHKKLYSRIAPRKGDILLAKNGTIGEVAIVDRDCEFDIYVTLALLRTVNHLVSPHYLLRAIGSATLQNFFKDSLIGIGVPNLHLVHIRKALIPIPPVMEQCRIVDIVDKTIYKIRNLDIYNDELQSLVEKARNKILDLAIRGKLVPQDPNDEPASVLLERIRAEKEELIKQGKIKRDKKESIIFKGEDNSYYQNLPENWELVTFSNIANLISGRDLKPEEYNSDRIGIPYITGASNFNKGAILINRWTTSPKSISIKNDILLSCKGTVGELAINDHDKIHIARQIMAIRVSTKINLEYIKLFFESMILEIKKSADGLIPGISRDDILSLNIPLPPLAEQNRIVKTIETVFLQLDEITNAIA